jgi:hypothetical protein
VGDRHGRGEEKRDIAAPATIAMATIGFIMSSPSQTTKDSSHHGFNFNPETR